MLTLKELNEMKHKERFTLKKLKALYDEYGFCPEVSGGTVKKFVHKNFGRYEGEFMREVRPCVMSV